MAIRHMSMGLLQYAVPHAVSFRPLTEPDLATLHRWLQTPHVRAHYSDNLTTLAEVRDHYLPRVTGADAAHPFVIVADRPIGYIQTYAIPPASAYGAALGVGEGAAGVDMLIGEVDRVHRGLGPVILRQFVDSIVWDLIGATACWIGPAIDNPIAIRAYAKAGFVHVKTAQIPGEAVPEYLMVRYRATASAGAR